MYFNEIVLIFIILFVIIFHNDLINKLIKVFRKRILIKNVLIMLIILLIIQKRIFLTFNIINFNRNKKLFKRIFIEIFNVLIVS